jgi:hypothetical protein
MHFLFLHFISFSSIFINVDSLNKNDHLVFNPHKSYIYEAIYTNSKGDTLSKEQIVLNPLGEPWKWQKVQTSIKVTYSYTPKDSITFLSYINPVTKNLKKPKRYIWYRSTITGAVENDSTLWMHPFRDNQYNYTELATYPKVNKLKLEVNGEWKEGLGIYFGWVKFIAPTKQ